MQSYRPGRRRLLVVEDDRDIRDLLLVALDAEGYEVQAADNGRVALELLRDWRPELILLDLTMPELDGWEFRARQRADRDLAPIPIVVLTGGPNLRARADELNAAAILTKPFALGVLLGLVRAILGSPEPGTLHSRN